MTEEDLPGADVIEGLDALEALADEWRPIAVRSGSAFTTPEWVLNWWRLLGERRRPLTVVLRSGDGSLRGLLPLALDDSGLLRRCAPAAAGLSDHQQPVAVGDDQDVLARAAASALAARRREWRLIALDRVDAADGWPDRLTAGLGAAHVYTRSRSALPYLELRGRGGWEEFLGSRSSSFRKRLRWLQRRLSERGARARITAGPEELGRDLDTLFTLHDRRWEGRGGSTIAAPARDFHRAFAAAAMQRGWLRLWTLDSEDGPIASWYGWRIGTRYAFYNGGFDPAWSKLSPGLFLLSRVLSSAFDEGAAEFDFLLGEEAYKSRFADLERPVRSVLISRARSPLRALIGVELAARRLGRRLPAGARHARALRALKRGLPGG